MVSTFGIPLACKVAMAALEVVKEEKLAEKAKQLGEIFPQRNARHKKSPYPGWSGEKVCSTPLRLLHTKGKIAWILCLKMAENGLLAKPTHGDIIRFAPPLVNTEEELMEAIVYYQGIDQVFGNSRIGR